MIDIEVTINDYEPFLTYSIVLPEDPAQPDFDLAGRPLIPANAPPTKDEIITALEAEIDRLHDEIADQKKKIEHVTAIEQWWARRAKAQGEKMFQWQQNEIRKELALEDALASETRLREELNALVELVRKQHSEIGTLTELNNWWQQHSAAQHAMIDCKSRRSHKMSCSRSGRRV